MAENSNEAQTQTLRLAEIVSIETRRKGSNVIDLNGWVASRSPKHLHLVPKVTSDFNDVA